MLAGFPDVTQSRFNRLHAARSKRKGRFDINFQTSLLISVADILLVTWFCEICFIVAKLCPSSRQWCRSRITVRETWTIRIVAPAKRQNLSQHNAAHSCCALRMALSMKVQAETDVSAEKHVVGAHHCSPVCNNSPASFLANAFIFMR